ncbi:MAG: hypothetical protein IPH77_17345 [Ignavibacteria bacterium]|nr:hypothetical protein [Ignavibacteria bacterium]
MNSNGSNSSSNFESKNKAYTRIKRKIRRSRIKAAVELYSEMLLILFVILLLILCMYFFFIFDPGFAALTGKQLLRKHNHI